MCQHNSKPLNRFEVVCYRVYELRRVNLGEEIEQSLFYAHPRPPLNQCTPASDEPFHAFMSLEQVAGWLKHVRRLNRDRDRHLVYRCKLAGDLFEGSWERTNMKTVTGYNLTIIEEVNSEILAIIKNEAYEPYIYDTTSSGS